MIRRLRSLLFMICVVAPANAQSAPDGAVEVPLSVPSQRTGIVPTNLLPMGALRIESGGVRLPGLPTPNAVEPHQSAPAGTPPGVAPTAAGSPPGAVRPAESQTPAPSSKRGSAQTQKPAAGCVGALDAPLQVQLGAVEGRAAAEKEADRLMRRHGDLLLNRPTPTDCSSNRKDLFRIRLAIPNPSEGQRLCNDLAGRGERCIIVRGGP